MFTLPPPPPPQPVTIVFDDQARESSAGDESRYTIKVRNNSGTAYPHAEISQLLPASLTHRKSSPAASRVTTSEVTWQVALPANGTVTLTMTGKIGEPAATGRKVSTTACVRTEPGRDLAACATDSNALVAAGPGILPLAGGGTAVLATAGGAWLIWRRRRS
ncbi:DUF11 domain-containing protein [Longispora albida]|uniref:DUF11 domain-containing protein n=1 Tax=Longispora albida TaxID=203523 RepID=UPI000361A842|nr:DUF11 domain-containing protein [Longispora albida]